MITNEIEIKKSRFITYLYEIENESEIEKIINNIKEEHKKARHVVYVYKINNNGPSTLPYGTPLVLYFLSELYATLTLFSIFVITVL